MSQVTPERIAQITWGFAAPLIVEAAIKNGVFDTLDAGPKTLEQMSAETGASQRGLRSVMDALVSIDLLSREDGCYALTPESATYLVSDKPTFAGGILRHISVQLLPKWMEINNIVRTGEPAVSVNRHENGAEFFRDFVEDIFNMSYAMAQALADTLNVAQTREPIHVLDLAAGSGVWGIALAEKSPQVRVTAVDWPEVLPVTRRVTARRGLADRYRFVEGDLMEANFGSGYQIATLGHILHSEGEKRSRALLSKVYDALAPGGRIAIGEMVPNEERTGPPGVMFFGVNMLVNTDEGDVYTFSQIRDWLNEAGFTNPTMLDVPGMANLILANKPA